MPFVKTYGKHGTGIVRSHSWLSPEVEDGNVFSSPETDAVPVNITSSSSVEKERNASVTIEGEPVAKQARSRRAKPKNFASFFSQSDESSSDKENIVPSDEITHRVPNLKLPQSRSTLRRQKCIIRVDESHITQRRDKSSSSTSSSSFNISSKQHRRKRRLSKLSRSSRKLRQDDGDLHELGRKSASSSSSSTCASLSSSWLPSSIDTTSTCSSHDQSYKLFDISELIGCQEDSSERELKTDTAEAKSTRSARGGDGKQKLAQKNRKQNLNQPQAKDTSTPVSIFHSIHSSNFSPVLFDTTSSPSIREDTARERWTLRDSVFEDDIASDLNRMNIKNVSDSAQFLTCQGELSANSAELSKVSDKSQKSLRSTKKRDPPHSQLGKSKGKASLAKNSKRGSKTDSVNITYTVRESRQTTSNIHSNSKASKKLESPQKDTLALTRRPIRKRRAGTDSAQCRDEDAEKETPAKVSPCTVLLEKLQVTQVNTPPRNNQLSRLLECQNSFKESLTPTRDRKSGLVVTARSKVLQQCEQAEPLPFSKILTEKELLKCIKVGEGTFGEVFLTTNSKKEAVALKIIPIEGDFKVNDEPQKTFEEILPEIVISRELSSMQTDTVNQTKNFIQVKRVACIQGAYPEHLLQQWDAYNKEEGSENDRPDVFDENQLFILFEFSNGGRDLEGVEFTSIAEAVSVLKQVAGALASAECQYGFEHRDLHWGNVLVRKSKLSKVTCSVEGDTFTIPSHGVEASIIDFTMSRLSKDGCTVFCDLTHDETLFAGKGDYQFDIYRKMKKENKNNWEAFNPHSNVLWLHYLLQKILKHKIYAIKPSKEMIGDLKIFSRHLLGYSSAEEVLRESELLQLLEECS